MATVKYSEVERSARQADPHIWSMSPPDISAAQALRQSLLETKVRLGLVRYNSTTEKYENVEKVG